MLTFYARERFMYLIDKENIDFPPGHAALGKGMDRLPTTPDAL